MPQRKAWKLVLRWAIALGLLYGCVSLLALSLKWLAARSEIWAGIGATFVYSDNRVRGEGIAVVGVVVLALIAPQWGRHRFAQWERMFARFAAQRKQAVLAAAALPVMARLALLPALPLPQPYMPDEFGYLLLADTFASGRVTNPTHPMWRYFETLYVFHQPTYTSLYPIAQGLFMAVPLALRAHAWLGVCASMGLMCAALAWMLQGWLPPKWALLGALLAGSRLGIATYWMNSYWGGAAGAIGGALLVGAWPRLLRRASVRDALLAALGAAVLSQSRPLEGALLTLPIAAMLAYRLARRAHRNIPALAALAGGALTIGAGTLYYNWRVTGEPWLWPYQLHQRIYGVPQNLRGSAPVLTAPRAAVQKDILENFNWQLGLFQAQSTWQGLAAALPEKMDVFWDFYLQPILSLPLLFLPLSLGRRGMRLLLFAGALALFAGFILYPFFFPHYAAPLYGLLLVLVLEGARRMRVLRSRGRRVGDPLFRWWLAAAGASCLLLVVGSALDPELAVQSATPRSRIEQDLKWQGGKHLVLVRYTEAHNYHHPWIYNSVDIDRSHVIWAREPDPPDMASLLRYYADRKIWLVEAGADEDTPVVRRLVDGKPVK